MSHNSPQGLRRARTYQRIDLAADTTRPQPMMTLAVGGSLLKIQAAAGRPWTCGGSKRGKVTTFSKDSRRRLLDLLSSINRERVRRLPLFVTLTYPAIYPDDGQKVKTHLDTFLKRLKRAAPSASAIWRLEYQKRGAPHFHLLVFGVPYLPHRVVALWWYAIVGSGDIRHLGAGVEVRQVRSWRGVMSYAGKYMAKASGPDVQPGCGRFWGVMNRDALPIELLVVPLTFQAFFRGRRSAMRWSKGKGYHRRLGGAWQGMKLYGEYRQLCRIIQCFT